MKEYIFLIYFDGSTSQTSVCQNSHTRLVQYLKMSNRDLLSDQGLRIDGRRPKELRRIKCKLGVFNQPDGSAYLEQGNTKVLVAVYGPHQVNIRGYLCYYQSN